MDIDKFAFSSCEACIENEKQTKICLSCMKILIYEGIKDGIYSSNIDFEKLIDKIEYLAEMTHELGIEIHKHRLYSRE